jgi:hypothetical protein
MFWKSFFDEIKTVDIPRPAMPVEKKKKGKNFDSISSRFLVMVKMINR